MIDAKVQKPQRITLVLADLRELDVRILGAAKTALTRGMKLATGVAQRDYLSGPRPLRLDVVSTRLRGSIAHEVKIENGKVVASLGSNVPYAAWHEYGFKGSVKVAAHTRVIHQVTRESQDYDPRRPIRDLQGNLLGYKDTRKETAARQKSGLVFVQYVKAHTRQINYRGRPFLRPAVNKVQDRITREISEELEGLQDA